LPLGENAVDITEGAAVTAMLARKMPDLVINLAAYTAVDQAAVRRPAYYTAVDRAAVRRLAYRSGCPIWWAGVLSRPFALGVEGTEQLSRPLSVIYAKRPILQP
jgi:hypothetical protein